MNSKSKRILTFSAIFIFLLGNSCQINDDCGPFVSELYVNDLTVQAVKLEPSANDQIDFTALSPSDSISAEQLAIHIIPVGEAAPYAGKASFQISFTNVAYACSPPIPDLQGYIANLEIISNNNIGEDFPAGTDLAELFDIYIVDRSKNLHYKKLDLQSYLETNPDIPDAYFLVLKNPATVSGKHKFSIEYYQSVGSLKTHTYSTDSVYLQ